MLLALVLFSTFAKPQDIKDLYTESFKSDWKIYEDEENVKTYIDTSLVYKLASGRTPEEELLYQAKKNHQKKADYLSAVFAKLDFHLKAYDSLVFIQQRSINRQPPFDFTKKGAIITADSIHGFFYDLQTKEIKDIDYLNPMDNEVVEQAKRMIISRITQGKTNHLDSIAKLEAELLSAPTNKILPQTEFEILIYNAAKEKRLRRVYLHETFVRIINEK